MLDDNALANAKILIVDDEEVNLLLLERILHKGGYLRLERISDSREALALFQQFEPDLVITDLHMPHLNGIEVIKQLNAQIPAGSYLPIAMLTADISAEAEQQALSNGAKDFFNKPFKSTQILLRVGNLLQTRFLHLELQRQNELLEERVKERTIELEAARLDILERLALAAEYRDHDTSKHTQRVGCLSEKVALKLGLPKDEAALLRRAATLHDVGKIGIPDQILLKPGKLSTSEFEVMKNHVAVGAKLLSKGHSELIRLAELITLTHHERFDGSGYPRGLSGADIPLVGQIVAVADVFDTLINERPYKQAWPVEQAIAEIKRTSGRWFNPQVVEAFLQVLADEPELLEASHLRLQ